VQSEVSKGLDPASPSEESEAELVVAQAVVKFQQALAERLGGASSSGAAVSPKKGSDADGTGLEEEKVGGQVVL
jgi:hypothetical protein